MQGIEDDDGNPAYWLRHDEDLLTDERKAKGDIFTVETEPTKIDRGGSQTRAYANDILSYYHKRGLVTGPQMRAGQKLHQLWYHGWASRYTTSRFGSEPGNGADFETVRHLALEYVAAMFSIHGDNGKSGQYAHVNYMKAAKQSVVIGHIHSFAGVNYEGEHFAVNAGCLIDESAYCFKYAKNMLVKVNLGCAVIYDGRYAEFVPMRLDHHGRWIGRL